MAVLWLYLHFPRLQLDSTYVASDGLRVIIDGQKNHINQLNGSALKAGLKKGMGLGSAAILCEQLKVEAYQPEQESRKLKEIAEDLYQITADISFFEPQGILLRVSTMLTLYQGAEAYWQVVRQHIPQSLFYHYASGFSPLSARLLARGGWDVFTDQAHLINAALYQRPLSETDLSPQHIEKLQRVGIGEMKTLLSLSMAEVAKRFDIELVHYVGRLLGQFKHPVNFYHPPQHFERRLELLFELDNLQWLDKPLTILLQQLEQFLRLRELKCHQLQLLLYQRDAEPLSLNIHSAAGEYRSTQWLTLCQLTLGSVQLKGPVQAIGIKGGDPVALAGEEGELFAQKSQRYSPLELLSVLQARMGQRAVKGVCLHKDPRPERRNQLCVPLTNNQTSSLPQDPQCLRPSLLFPQPRPLQEKVSIVRGPERLTTGWWDQHIAIRDYFIARDKPGRWLWIFRDNHQRWYLHGIFS